MHFVLLLLEQEILVHGRVYVTPNYICFYANIFKWETRVVIKCKDIDSINKTNTAKVIPNAIQINTHQGEKYTLTSFAARDKTYVMIFRVWQNALLGQSMSSSQLWQWIRCSYGDDLGFSSDEEEEAKEDFAAHLDRQKRFSSSTSGDDSPDVLGTKAKTSHTRPKRHVNIEEPIRENDAGIEGDDEVYEDQDESLPFLDPISCGCPDHKGKLLADVSLPIPVETTYKLIFSESKWYKNMMADRKAMKLQFTPWQECSDEEKCLTAKKKRVVTYTVVLNYAMLKSAPTIETQYLQEMRDGQVYKVQTQAVNTDIPYCDTFYVATQYCLTRGRQENETRVLIHSEVVITSNSWSFRVMRPIVEKNAQQGIADFINDLVSCLNKYCNDGPKEIVNEITEFAAAVDLEMMVPSASRSGSLDSRKSLRRRLGSGVTVEDTLAAERNMWSPMDEVRMNQLNSLKKSRSESLKNTGYVPQEGFVTLKIILGVLVALFISNMWLYFQLWKLESAADSYETLIRSSLESSAGRGTLSPSQDSVDALRIVLSRAIEMVKSLEQNLQDLNNDLKNKLWILWLQQE